MLPWTPPHPIIAPSLTLKHAFSASRQIRPHTNIPGHVPSSFYTGPCLLVLRAPLRVLQGHKSISLYTIQRYSVRITSRVSFLGIPVQLIISKDYLYFHHKYVSTSHRIVHALTRHLLDSNTYTSTVMQYTTRHLPTGTACISHATPTRVAVLSWHLHSVSLSPPAHTTRASNSSPSTVTQLIFK